LWCICCEWWHLGYTNETFCVPYLKCNISHWSIILNFNGNDLEGNCFEKYEIHYKHAGPTSLLHITPLPSPPSLLIYFFHNFYFLHLMKMVGLLSNGLPPVKTNDNNGHLLYYLLIQVFGWNIIFREIKNPKVK